MVGWLEIGVVAGVLLLLFGAKRIPELARSLGRAEREFRKARAGKDAEHTDQKTHGDEKTQ